jgi:hypothetical protein
MHQIRLLKIKAHFNISWLQLDTQLRHSDNRWSQCHRAFLQEMWAFKNKTKLH